jgi:hypothetical protein
LNPGARKISAIGFRFFEISSFESNFGFNPWFLGWSRFGGRWFVRCLNRFCGFWLARGAECRFCVSFLAPLENVLMAEFGACALILAILKPILYAKRGVRQMGR